MAIRVRCNQCGRSYEVQDAFAGQRLACPGCKTALLIPRRRAPQSTGRVSRPQAETLTDDVIIDDPPVAPPVEPDWPPEPPRRSALPTLILLVVFFLFLAGVGATFLILALRAPSSAEQKETTQAANGNTGKSGTDTPSPGDKGRDTGTDKGGDTAPDRRTDTAPDRRTDTAPDRRTETPPDHRTETPPDRRTETPPPPAGAWQGHRIGVLALSVTADGKHVLSAAGGVEKRDEQLAPAADTCVIRWDAATGKEVSRLADFRDGISAAAFSADGRFAAVVSAGKRVGDVWTPGADTDVHLWDLTANREVKTLRGHEKTPFTLAFSPDGLRLASAGRDHVVAVWDLDTNKSHFLAGHKRAVNGLSFSPDGRLLLSASGDTTVRLWDADQAREAAVLEGHKDIVWAVAFGPKGLAVSGGGGAYDDIRGRGFVPGARDYDIRVWDVNKKAEVGKLSGHGHQVNALAVSPDGRRVLSGGKDLTVRLWQLSGFRQVAKFEGHTADVTAVVFLPDGRHALSAAADGSFRLHELPPDLPELVRRLRGPRDQEMVEAVRSLAVYGSDASAAVPDLLDLALQKEPALRRAALDTLPKVGTPGKESVPRLTALL